MIVMSCVVHSNLKLKVLNDYSKLLKNFLHQLFENKRNTQEHIRSTGSTSAQQISQSQSQCEPLVWHFLPIVLRWRFYYNMDCKLNSTKFDPKIRYLLNFKRKPLKLVKKSEAGVSQQQPACFKRQQTCSFDAMRFWVQFLMADGWFVGSWVTNHELRSTEHLFRNVLPYAF